MNERKAGYCKKGHPVTPGTSNAYEYAPGKFKCRMCHAEASKAYRRRNVNVEDGAVVRTGMHGIGLGAQWMDFESLCAKSEMDLFDTLGDVLRFAIRLLPTRPDILLDLDVEAFRKYLMTAIGKTSDGESLLRDLNKFLAEYGKGFDVSTLTPKPAASPAEADSITF